MNKMIDVIGIYSISRAKNMEFCRAAAEAITEPSRNRCFSVLHARRDLREQDIAFGEVCESFTDFTQWPLT